MFSIILSSALALRVPQIGDVHPERAAMVSLSSCPKHVQIAPSALNKTTSILNRHHFWGGFKVYNWADL